MAAAKKTKEKFRDLLLKIDPGKTDRPYYSQKKLVECRCARFFN